MAVDTMKVIQQILEHLDKSMDDEEVDLEPVSAEALGISEARRARVIGLMIDSGLIDGFIKTTTMNSKYDTYTAGFPQITLSGIQFMADNALGAKAYRVIKEIRDWIK